MSRMARDFTAGLVRTVAWRCSSSALSARQLGKPCSRAMSSVDQICAEARDARAGLPGTRAELQELRDCMIDFRAETIHRFQQLDNRVDIMALTVQSADDH